MSRMLKMIFSALVALILLLWQPARADNDDQPLDLSQAVKLSSGLQYIDRKIGDGALPKFGEIVVVKYTGWLLVDGKKGDEFDSSKAQGKPVQFVLGKHRVIAGWDEGVASMKQGGMRMLIVPAALGYGDRGAGGVIPPGATLLFDVELVAIKPPPLKPEMEHPI